MNEEGFGLKEFIIIIAVIFISMIIVRSLASNIFKTKETVTEPEEETITYQDLESDLKKAAERYQNNTYSGNIEDTEIWTLSYSMLKEEDYLDKLMDPNDKTTECTGYVEFIQDKGEISYTPYLKCGKNYQTKGYDENNIE